MFHCKLLNYYSVFWYQIETEQTMEQIKKDTAIAEETKIVVTKEEKEATIKAETTQAIADDAKKDLDEALPMLDAALASLKSLNKNDVTEVRIYYLYFSESLLCSSSP